MNKKDKDYYGIKFNNDVPKIDKINEYSKEVEIKFIGEAYLVVRKKDKVEKTKLENYHKFEKEGTYEIEFTNNKNEVYTLNLRIEKSFLFIIILFFIGATIFTMCLLPANNENLINKVLSLIDLSVLKVDIDEQDRYVFDVDFKNIISSDIELPSTINAKSVTNNKIAPGTDGEFSIIISTKDSTVNMSYSVDFEDVTNEKPSNLLFKVKGTTKEYSSLQELEKYLKGTAPKQSQIEYVIEWRWPYELDEVQDKVDTNDGSTLTNYKFRIHVTGEEVI